MDIPISETLTLAEVGKDEAWLQEQIWNNPAQIGLGDLEAMQKEKSVSSGGRLDILLKNPDDDTMYEVEVQLGATDPSHIIRTIEYWDLIRKKWPQRQHFAVLIAEQITSRFFNVIQLMSTTIPMIAIQVNIVKIGETVGLNFTKILDVYEEPEDDTTQATVDESFWVTKSPDALNVIRKIKAFTDGTYNATEVRFNKRSIVILQDGSVMLGVVPRSGSVLVAVRHGGNDEIKDGISSLFDQNAINYVVKKRMVQAKLKLEAIDGLQSMFEEVAKLNNRWWAS